MASNVLPPHYTGEVKKPTNQRAFGICVRGILGQGDHVIIVVSSFLKKLKMFASTLKREDGVFKLLRISNTRDSVSSGYPNTGKGVKNTTRSGVFLTKFEVFG